MVLVMPIVWQFMDPNVQARRVWIACEEVARIGATELKTKRFLKSRLTVSSERDCSFHF